MTDVEIIEALLAERKRQDALWGEQDHPDYSGSPAESPALFKRYEVAYKEWNANCVKNGTLGWESIFCEEVFEALASETPEEREKELIQVMAVAANWIQSSKRRRALAAAA